MSEGETWGIARPRTSTARVTGREESRTQSRARLLGDVIGAFADATTNYDELLAVISRKLAEVVGDLCSVLVVSPDLATLSLVATYDPDPAVLAIALDTFSDEPFVVVPTQQ